MSNVTVNNEQRLYVIPCGSGFSCYGFDVLARKLNALRKEMGLAPCVHPVGSLEMYAEWESTLAQAQATGKRYTCDLHPLLIGKEGYRVECIMYGRKVRFNVGRSTGFLPWHLQVHNARSVGGNGISADADIKDLRIIRRA